MPFVEHFKGWLTLWHTRTYSKDISLNISFFRWETADAEVACRQLGYSGGEARQLAPFGEGQGRIWLDNVECSGNESELNDCTHNGWGNNNCWHGEDAGVVCDRGKIRCWDKSTWWKSWNIFHVTGLLWGGIHGSLVNFPHKGQLCGALVSSLFWTWTNGWANYRDAGELSRHCAHYGVTVM